MTDDPIHDDSSHYEVSLTAGQAFTAFVLLLLSLAASFAFGVVIGRGGAAPTSANRGEATITEGAATAEGDRVPAVEVPVTGATDFEPPAKAPVEPSVVDKETIEARPAATEAPGVSAAIPYFAQILSTREGPAAEALAAKLIDDGFRSAYVERVPAEGGLIYRVRVRFPTEADARSAVSRLRGYAPGEIWVSHE